MIPLALAGTKRGPAIGVFRAEWGTGLLPFPARHSVVTRARAEFAACGVGPEAQQAALVGNLDARRQGSESVPRSINLVEEPAVAERIAHHGDPPDAGVV